MLSLKTYIQNPRLFLASVLQKVGFWIPDKWYLQMFYYLNTGKPLNLKNPLTFSEKLQWLKLYNRKPEYTMMVDKYAVKEYVAGIIGKEHIIPTLGVWDRPEDINFDDLPQQFVLKTTHGGGSGGVIVCVDKTQLKKESVIKSLQQALKGDIYKAFREWPYKDVKRRIIAEQYIGKSHEDLKDYKFFCFNGEPKYCQVISGRHDVMSIDFFDTEWNHQPFHEPKQFPFSQQKMDSPLSLSKMLKYSQLLSTNIPFIRVDFYEVNGLTYFGELTFFPTSGVGGFDPKEWDGVFGEMISLPLQ